MSFKNLFKKNKNNGNLNGSSAISMSDKEKKSILGLKNMQAQQNPEPIYDLSDCYTSFLPNDTYTFCKLLRKTTLDIKNNCLTSMETGGSFKDLSELRILIASHNIIEKLPNIIGVLHNLKILDISYNKLKCLPDSFKSLKALENLDLSSNRFTKVPVVVCALPKLQVLSMNDNDIKTIPKEIVDLHHTLCRFDIDYNKIENIASNYTSRGLEGIMDYLCTEDNIIYDGPTTVCEDSVDASMKYVESTDTSPVDDIMLSYMKKKQEQLKAQLLEEEQMRSREKQQLENVLYNSSKSKQGLLQEIYDENLHIHDYEDKKKEKVNNQMEVEKMLRNEQNEQLDLYLTNSNNKDSLLKNLATENDNLNIEIEVIVSAKEVERLRLVQDLSKAVHDTDLALQELLTLQQSQKSSDYLSLLKEQEDQMQNLLSNIVENSTELKRADVLKAMRISLYEEASVASQRDKIEQEKKSWVSMLLNEGKVEEAQMENLLNNKAANQESFLASVLQEEEYQTEAFKLLLLKMDLKRNSVIRQIAMVEYELTRLSSLELRKKRCGVQYGSTTMLGQRKTLVGLLKSLLKAKNERDEELDDWVSQLSQRYTSDMTSEDFWLLQYQKLMSMKPASITQAEEELDPKVCKVLSMANAIDLAPLFAKQNVTFDSLLDMCEDDFSEMGIGLATYHSIQRALHSYLLESKIGPQVPSAPYEEYEASAPKLEEEEEEAIGVLPPALESRPSAPPQDAQFIETECVVCLSNDCRVLFIPCGHVCVCASCCQPLINCPLCRSDITNKCFIGYQ